MMNMLNERLKKMTYNQRIIIKIALIGVLSALCYIAVMFSIPIPSPMGKPMIHFGNLIVIIAALLFGGSIGGISGAIGMGLYDTIAGYDIWSITRTIILKLLMGLIVGIIYNKLIKKENSKNNYILILLGSLLLAGGITLMVIAIAKGGLLEINNIGEKTIEWPSYVFSIINGLFLLFVGIFANKMPSNLKVVSIATSIAIVVNILGEFIYKVLKQMTLGGSNFSYSVGIGLLSIPATLINGAITLAIVLLIFIPIESAVKKILTK